MKEKIKIIASSSYLPSQSLAFEKKFIWIYDITIVNDSEHVVQLLNRHWNITDITGFVEEVTGPGVVGLQPVIKPGKEFSYTSLCQLSTSQGTMEGYYEMNIIENDEEFKATIPKFVLTSFSDVATAYQGVLH